MPKKPAKRSKPDDPNVAAFDVVRRLTGDDKVVGHIEAEPEPERQPDANTDGKNPAAVALGRLGGLKGGRARADKLSAERKTEIAKQAAAKRWKGNRNGDH